MRSSIVRVSLFGFGVVMLVCSMAQNAMASTTVPEIDGGTLSAGLAAATATVLILRSRRRSK